MKRVIAFMVAVMLTLTCVNMGGITQAAAKTKKPGKATVKSITRNEQGAIILKVKPQSGASWYDVYRSTKPNSGFHWQGTINTYEDSENLMYCDSDATGIQTYYYKVRAVCEDGMRDVKGAFSNVVSIAQTYCIWAEVKNETTITLHYPAVNGATKYLIYRSLSKNDGFELISTKENSYYSSDFTFEDKNLVLGTKYYYKVVAGVYEQVEVTTQTLATTEAPATTEASRSEWDDFWGFDSNWNSVPNQNQNRYVEPVYEDRLVAEYPSNVIEAMTGPAGVDLKKATVTGKGKMTVTWKQSGNASGYLLAKKENDGTIIQLKKISGGTKTSCKLTKVPHGASYNFVIIPYIMKDGICCKGAVSDELEGVMNYYSCQAEDYQQRCQRIFGRKSYKSYSSDKKARKNMKTIRIRAWDFKKGTSGKKITKHYNLTVHKNIASSVKKAFEEIYKGKEKFPIHSIGAYSYRKGEHMMGLAIDINPEENYQIRNDGTILCGRLYKPGKNPYSIPMDGEFAHIMNKYGFTQGIFSSSRDYMHFSYFGG